EIECEIDDEKACDGCSGQCEGDQRGSCWRCDGCNPCDYCPLDECPYEDPSECDQWETVCSNCTICEDCEDYYRCENCDRISEAHKKISEELQCLVGKNEDDYDPRYDFQYVYYDGSVNTELVTRAMRLYEIPRILSRAYDVLHSYDAEIDPSAGNGAGGHQTVSFGEVFPDVVVMNVIQLVRYYLPALLAIGCVQGTEKRGDYRDLVGPAWKKDEVWTKKYSAVHMKQSKVVDAGCDLIEFRYPDSHVNVWQTVLTALINITIVAKAIKLSAQGVFSFYQSHWERVKENVESFYENGYFNDETWVKELAMEMLDDLKEVISELAEFQSVKEGVTEIVNHRGLYPKNYNDIKPLRLKGGDQ
ncbi:MAG: hypothetical protein ACXQTM_04990, partial [Methanosarcinales archaeon]